MTSVSLLTLTRKQSFKWTGFATVVTVLVCSSLIALLSIKDSEREVLTTASASVLSFRTDILSGNIRTIELQLNSEFKKSSRDLFLFLDQSKRPWVTNPNIIPFSSCAEPGKVCRDLMNEKLIVDIPVYFDSEGKNLWGFLHVEKTPNIHWEIILTVSLAFLLGMLSLAFLLHSQFMKSIGIVSSTMHEWGEHLQKNLKDSQNFDRVPFKELEPIATSLRGLNKEISDLEESAQKRGSLNTLRSIGHDILNPVSRMKRIIGVLKIQQNFSQDELVKSLESDLKRLSGYAEQIKSLYKRETGDAQFSPSFTDLSLEIENLAVDLLNDQEAVNKNLKVELSLAQNCFVNAPSSILNRIAENLIVNSFHASLPNSVVKVSTFSLDQNVVLCVRDNGSGIPPSIKDRIFDANFTTKINKGTGLGLFVVKQLCEEHGGSIKCTTTEGQGTSFEISFPYSGAFA